MRVKALPTPPYTITIGFLPNIVPSANAWAGVVWYDSVSGKLHTISMSFGMSYIPEKWNSVTSFNASYGSIDARSMMCGSLAWIQLQDDNTNRKTNVSADGVNWVTPHTILRTDFLTPNQIGFFINAKDADTCIQIVSWKEG